MTDPPKSTDGRILRDLHDRTRQEWHAMGTDASTTVLDLLWHGLPAPGTGTLSGSATVALPARYEAVKNARDFTGRTLHGWGVAGEFDNVALVVSELVTNALRHGLPHGAGPRAEETPVRLHLTRWSARLVCAVRDPSRKAPVKAVRSDVANGFEPWEAEAGFAAESGRGLQLVDSFSDCWGWHQLSGVLPGKVVWAMFRLA